MPNYKASDVAKLRAETDAPIMECKAALDEADGDYDRAKEILREKGKVAAAKRAGRSTAAGVVAFAANAEATKLGGAVVECETDFVARNADFIALAQEVAVLVRDGSGPAADDPKIQELLQGAVGKIRENIRLAQSAQLETTGKFLTYVHHDNTKGAAVEVLGASNDEAVRKVAIQAVAFPPDVLKKEDLPQEKIDHEIEMETKRAIDEGKPENIAKNIATGRVNKEYIKRVVLLEQAFYTDPTKSVAQYLAESAKGSTVASFVYLAIGQGA